MLFQVLCGFEPVFYTTHPNEEPQIVMKTQDLTYLKWSHIRSSSGTAGTFLKSESSHRFYGGTWATTTLFKKNTDENIFCEYNAGSGEFLVVNIIDQILHAKNDSVVLIDEPEISLHPGAQRRLLRVILSSIIKKKLQVIISTHSRDIVGCLPSKAIICVEKQNNGFSRVENNILPEQAFIEIEVTPDAKQIIVEDDMACAIVQGILKEEKLCDLMKVIYIPGGASNLKKYTVGSGTIKFI